MSQVCTDVAPPMTSPNYRTAAGARRSGASRRHESATLGRLLGRAQGRWSVGAVWAALATLAITLGGCESPSALAPTAQSPLTITAQGRLERGATVELQVTRNGTPVNTGDVTWTTSAAGRVRLVQPDTAVLMDTGDVTIIAHVGIGNTTLTVHVAAPPAIVFAMHDVGTGGALGDYDVYRASLDGEGLTRLTSGTADNVEPTAANGVVVFTSYRDGYPALYRVSLGGGAESRLPGLAGSAFQPSLSPDGSHLAFIAPDSGLDKLWLAASDGSGAVRPTANAGSSSAEEASPSWSPSGGAVAFVSTTLGNAAIFGLAAATDSAWSFTDGTYTDVDPSWSPDGRSVAFASTRDGDLGIFVLTVATGQVTRVSPSPSNAGQPCWLPDGRIVYTEESSTASGIISQLNWTDPSHPGVAHVIPTPAGNPENAQPIR
jgi:Tol biopolymer transport system component